MIKKFKFRELDSVEYNGHPAYICGYTSEDEYIIEFQSGKYVGDQEIVRREELERHNQKRMG